MEKDSYLLKRGEAKALEIAKGQKIRISCENESQLADLVFSDYSAGLTLDNLCRLTLRPGDLLYDSHEEPVLKVASIHSEAKTNILYPGCRRSVYKRLYGQDKPGCRELLSGALGIAPNRLPSTINLFMDFEIVAPGVEDKFEMRKSRAKAGDYVEFEALQNTAMAVSACPDEVLAKGGLIRIKVE